MLPFRMPWAVRRFIRRHTTKMDQEDVWRIKSKLSIIYMIIAWQAFAFTFYQISKGNKHWPTKFGLTTEEQDNVRPALYFAHKLNVDKADVYRVKGFDFKNMHKDTIDVDVMPLPEGPPLPPRITVDIEKQFDLDSENELFDPAL